jgi:ABC-type transport system involved in multi-copper enzyme maturation permease subunit
MLGFIFLFSSLFKSSTYSIVAAGGVFLFGFNLLQDFAIRLAHIEPWFTLTYGGSIIANVLTPTGYPPHTVIVHGTDLNSPVFTAFNATIPEGLAIMLVYFIVTAAVGLVLFQRKEFN